MNKLTFVVLCLVFAGCTATTSRVMIGETRTPTDAASVRLYFSPPAHYKEIATIAADSKGGWHLTAEGRVDGALKQLKIEAAKLGANGILMTSAGESAAATATAGTPAGSGTSSSTPSDPEMIGNASGTAIWVEPAK